MGVFLLAAAALLAIAGLPHARGGVSPDPRYLRGLIESSPRPWGCFQVQARLGSVDRVFPTPVGVFLRLTTKGLP